MNKEKAKSIINNYREKGMQTFYSIQFIEDYNSKPFLTDPVMLSNSTIGSKLKKLSTELSIKQIRSDCKVKDSKGNPTTCSEYEIVPLNTLPADNRNID
jgi:hypothetical protein